MAAVVFAINPTPDYSTKNTNLSGFYVSYLFTWRDLEHSLSFCHDKKETSGEKRPPKKKTFGKHGRATFFFARLQEIGRAHAPYQSPEDCELVTHSSIYLQANANMESYWYYICVGLRNFSYKHPTKG